MEGRKLQLAGGSTYLVSLPKRWVVASGLKAGDTVFLETTVEGTVSIRPHAGESVQVRRKIFEERGSASREHLLRKLLGAYVAGFAVIEVRFPPTSATSARRVAREFCHLVIGPEVIEENRSSLVLRDLSDARELGAEKCLRRMQLTVRSMLQDAVAALRDSDASLSREVALRGQDVNRLYWMIAKQHHLVPKHPAPSGADGAATSTTGYLLIARLLERIGDHARRIASTFPVLAEGRTLDPKLAKDLDEALRSAVNLLDRSFAALVGRNIEGANLAIDARPAHRKLIDALAHRVAKRRGEELLALGLVVDSLGRAAGCASEIAEEAIDLSVLDDRGAS